MRRPLDPYYSRNSKKFSIDTIFYTVLAALLMILLTVIGFVPMLLVKLDQWFQNPWLQLAFILMCLAFIVWITLIRRRR